MTYAANLNKDEHKTKQDFSFSEVSIVSLGFKNYWRKTVPPNPTVPVFKSPSVTDIMSYTKLCQTDIIWFCNEIQYLIFEIF